MVHGLVMSRLWSQALLFALILYKVYDNKKMFSFWMFSVSFMSSFILVDPYPYFTLVEFFSTSLKSKFSVETQSLLPN